MLSPIFTGATSEELEPTKTPCRRRWCLLNRRSCRRWCLPDVGASPTRRRRCGQMAGRAPVSNLPFTSTNCRYGPCLRCRRRGGSGRRGRCGHPCRCGADRCSCRDVGAVLHHHARSEEHVGLDGHVAADHRIEAQPHRLRRHQLALRHDFALRGSEDSLGGASCALELLPSASSGAQLAGSVIDPSAAAMATTSVR